MSGACASCHKCSSPAAYASSTPQVAHQPVERLLVGVVLLPAGISDEAPLAAPRKGWLERVLEALRRR
jgi:hypothetical protein